MFFRAASAVLLAAFLASPAEKNPGVTRGENEDLIVTATLYITPTAVKELLGNDLGAHFIVADVRVQPKYGKKVAVARDDFLMRNLDNNERSTPFAPAQIAGHAALVVRRASDADDSNDSKKDGKKTSHRPTLSGIGGMSSPGNEPEDRNISAKLQNADEPKDAALEKLLNDKELPEKTSDQPVSGLLYFAFEKVKLKDLQLEYGPKDSRLVMRFKESK